ncbi:MAG: hypothetical protein ABL995_12405 [Bryobacteraceae bacterium]
MKKRLLLLPLILASVVLAQPPDGGFRRGQANTGTAPTAADILARRVQMLTKMLSLTSSQQTQVTTLLANEAASLAVNAPTLQADRASLLDAIKTNNSGQIDVLAAKIANVEGQQNAIRAKTAASIYALLDATQKGTVGDKLRGIMGGMGGPGGPGGGPGFGPRR